MCMGRHLDRRTFFSPQKSDCLFLDSPAGETGVVVATGAAAAAGPEDGSSTSASLTSLASSPSAGVAVSPSFFGTSSFFLPNNLGIGILTAMDLRLLRPEG